MVMCVIFLLFFFFSSRRRHTRFDCDWSSDVCSSDLEGIAEFLSEPFDRELVVVPSVELAELVGDFTGLASQLEHEVGETVRLDRKSRRVGKECRSRGSPYH